MKKVELYPAPAHLVKNGLTGRNISDILIFHAADVMCNPEELTVPVRPGWRLDGFAGALIRP